MELKEIIKGITAPDEKFYNNAIKRFDSIAKPIGSFGKLEDIIAQICSIEKTNTPKINKSAVAVFCSDNGIVDEGVSQVGQFVTSNVFRSITENSACINTLSKETGTDVFAVDVGINDILPKDLGIHRKISMGTRNFLKGPAMEKEDTLKAISTGFETAEYLKGSGYDILIAGEMGIGNTTTSSAVTACLLKLDPSYTTGKGAGLKNAGLIHKIDVIREGIRTNEPDPSDVIDVLSKLGGFDIASMCGFYLGCAYHKIPCILDGFISMTAALCAYRLNPVVLKYLIPSHKSSEKGMEYLLKELKLEPILDGNFHQGEGCGAVTLLPVLKLGISIYLYQNSFYDIDMEPYERL